MADPPRPERRLTPIDQVPEETWHDGRAATPTVDASTSHPSSRIPAADEDEGGRGEEPPPRPTITTPY